MDEALFPLLLVLGTAFIVPQWSPNRPLLTTVVTLMVGVVLARYLHWRVTETVLPANGSLPEICFIWLVFLCELWLWYETTVRRWTRMKPAFAPCPTTRSRPSMF